MIRSRDIPDFERSARRDLRYWALLIIGALFSYGGFTIDPASNCDPSGRCAPWLVPVATVMGLGALTMAGGVLLANPGRGSRYDPVTRELRWWQRRTGRARGDTGCILVDDIAVVRLQRGSDSDDISLYDRDGERLAYFDSEVVPWPHADWASRLTAIAPAIRIEEV